MKKIIVSVFLASLIGFLSPVLAQTSFYDQDNKLKVYQFGSNTCPHCQNEKKFLTELESQYNNLEVVYLDVWGDDNTLMHTVADKFGITVNGVPFLVIGKDYVIGFSTAEITGPKIEEKIIKCLDSGCDNMITGEQVQSEPVKVSSTSDFKIRGVEVKNLKMYNRLQGRIILKVKAKGEAYYFHPTNQKMYYLGRPADAFEVMRNFGLGISNSNFESFNGVAPASLAGRILLKVEAAGEAYYVNPLDLKMYYLGRPADAFQVMRDLGLGISNADFNSLENSN